REIKCSLPRITISKGVVLRWLVQLRDKKKNSHARRGLRPAKDRARSIHRSGELHGMNVLSTAETRTLDEYNLQGRWYTLRVCTPWSLANPCPLERVVYYNDRHLMCMLLEDL
ncbi:hypothetical protein PV325_006012, partial [Microctonus aethiopoides]